MLLNDGSLSLGDRVYNEIEKNIINGIYEKGTNLREIDLSNELQVSRTPVREALKQLAREGLVELVPNRGAKVVGLSKKDILEIFAIRKYLEGYAAKLACKNINENQLNELKEAFELLKFSSKENINLSKDKWDTRFHEIIYEASGSVPLFKTLTLYNRQIALAKSLSFTDKERSLQILDEHQKILDAISKKKCQDAEKAAKKHINKAIKYLKDKI